MNCHLNDMRLNVINGKIIVTSTDNYLLVDVFSCLIFRVFVFAHGFFCLTSSRHGYAYTLVYQVISHR